MCLNFFKKKVPQIPQPIDNVPPEATPPAPVNNQPYKVVPSSPNYGDYPELEKMKLGIVARRVCALNGLTPELTQELLATIVGESGFNPNCVHKNIVNGQVSSTDFGIAQINDYWHIGPKKDFPDVNYVMTNIEGVIGWMAKMFLEGKADLWVAHKNWKQHINQIP